MNKASSGKRQRAYLKRVKSPEPWSSVRVIERSLSSLGVPYRSCRPGECDQPRGIRTYPAANKSLPPGPKKPRGPRVVDLEKFVNKRTAEFIALQFARGKKLP